MSLLGPRVSLSGKLENGTLEVNKIASIKMGSPGQIRQRPGRKHARPTARMGLAKGTLTSMTKIYYWQCSKCGERLSAPQPQTICPKAGGSLYVRYELASLKGKVTRVYLLWRPATIG